MKKGDQVKIKAGVRIEKYNKGPGWDTRMGIFLGQVGKVQRIVNNAYSAGSLVCVHSFWWFESDLELIPSYIQAGTTAQALNIVKKK